MSVSIPDRYAKNGITEASQGRAENAFQFLIGTLKTASQA